MVVNRVLLPVAGTKSLDLDGDGEGDNALGTILLALSAAVPSLELQERLDTAVYMGRTLMLIRTQASSFVDADRALAQVWHGEGQTCCTTVIDRAACKAQATQTCFSGTHPFKPDPVTPNTSVLGGQIKSGHAAFGPAKMALSLPLSPQVTLEAEMIGVRVHGDLTLQGMSNGLVGGAIQKSQLESKVVPVIAQLLQDEVDNPKTPQSTRDTILNSFDTDKDGHISNSEVKGHGLVKTFLNGDVDVDGDHVNELSVGFRIEAVRAVIDD